MVSDVNSDSETRRTRWNFHLDDRHCTKAFLNCNPPYWFQIDDTFLTSAKKPYGKWL